jgi:hypothetical protein
MVSTDTACHLISRHLSQLSCDQLAPHKLTLTRLKMALEGFRVGAAAGRLKYQVEGALLTLDAISGTLTPSQVVPPSAEAETFATHTTALFFQGAAPDRAAEIAEAMRTAQQLAVQTVPKGKVQQLAAVPGQKGEAAQMAKQAQTTPCQPGSLSSNVRCSVCGLLRQRTNQQPGNWCAGTGSVSCRLRALSALSEEQRAVVHTRVAGEDRDESEASQRRAVSGVFVQNEIVWTDEDRDESEASQRRAVAGEAASERAACAAAALVSSWPEGTKLDADRLVQVCLTARQAHQQWQLSVEPLGASTTASTQTLIQFSALDLQWSITCQRRNGRAGEMRRIISTRINSHPRIEKYVVIPHNASDESAALAAVQACNNWYKSSDEFADRVDQLVTAQATEDQRGDQAETEDQGIGGTLLFSLRNRPVLMFGGPGCGKTFAAKRLVQLLRTTFGKEAVPMLAIFGLVAQNVNGATLASWGGLGLDDTVEMNVLYERIISNPQALSRWRKARVIVIDDASLWSAEGLDNFDLLAQKILGNPAFCGGLILVLTFDLQQLFPVSTPEHPRQPLFRSNNWEWLRSNALSIHFKVQHRFQNDPNLSKLLEAIRTGDLLLHHHQQLKDMSRPLPQGSPRPVYLAPRNTQVWGCTSLEPLQWSHKHKQSCLPSHFCTLSSGESLQRCRTPSPAWGGTPFPSFFDG